jgi:anthranilate phosphoribosyltransferase
MPIMLDPQEPAINRGIKTVGVGKKGSKDLSEGLTREILEDLKANKVSSVAKGAFLAGLLAKGIEPHEEILAEAFAPGVFQDPAKLIQAIAGDAPDFVQWICGQLLNGQTLDKQTAYDLGKFLFSDEPGDGARGLVASFLRVRYETADEYEGLLQAVTETLSPAFKSLVPPGAPIVQLAEPFDGVDHSYMITPLLGNYIQSLGYRVIHMVGKNSGPKFEMNLWDIAQALGEKAASGNQELANPSPRMGWFFHQSDMSTALDRWVKLRHQTIKRPFLSTLERFLNPAKADILIASAFHPPYGEKMLTIAERAGFKGIVIVRNGIEGTMAFPLLRPVKILISAKKKDGSFFREEKTLDPVGGIDIEQRIEKPQANDNAQLIENYLKQATSGNLHFDLRVKVTNEGLQQALDRIKFLAS